MNEIQTPAAGSRPQQITREYIRLLDNYIRELKEGKTDRVMEIRDFASLLHIHPVHLSNTIRETTGHSTCHLFEMRLVQVAKELLKDGNRSIGDIARQLTYDPSNFTKFFKHFEGITPRQFRNALPAGSNS